MIDLHMHTFYSDGALVPSELARRAAVKGIKTIAFTDHIDESNIELVERIARFCQASSFPDINLLPGAELTHVPPKQIGDMIERCRQAGAKIVIVHGETVVEPVAPGTNRAAIDGGADIVAHPGLITMEEAELAATNGVALELSGRGGHSFANGHVMKVARATGAPLIFNSDAHQPHDLMDQDMASRVVLGAGATQEEMESIFSYAQQLAQKNVSHQ